MSSSSSSSPLPSSSSSSSSSSPCWNREGSYDPNTGEANLDDCGSFCICTIPDSVKADTTGITTRSRFGFVPLPCRPPNVFLTLAAATTSRIATIRVPVVSDARQWRTVEVPVNKATNKFSTSGWRFVFQFAGDIPGRSTTPVVLPSTVPRATVNKEDLVLTAMVVLPESDGDNQYCIPVMEQFLFALLETKDWTVIVEREEIILTV